MWSSADLTLRDMARLESSRAEPSDGASVLIIGAAFVLVGAIVSSKVDDAVLRVVANTGALIAVARIVVLSRRPAASALGSFAFAACLGALGARTLIVGDEGTRTLVVALAIGYAAGLLMRGVSRPWVSVPSLFLASAPMIVAAFWKWDAPSLALGTLMVLMLAGGLERLKRLHDDFLAQIALRRKFENLARVDELTGLSNRLALRERRDKLLHGADREAGTVIAAHCLDLDRFKPVNDALGHAAGDAVLKVVAGRLSRTAGPGDLVARVGGDEFVVVQVGATGEDDALALARRLVEAIQAPCVIAGRVLTIDASVGTAVAPADGLDLDHLIHRADAALCERKARRNGAGVSRVDSVIPMPPPLLASGRFPGSRPSRTGARSLHG